MEFIEVSAKTVDDAITKACIDLAFRTLPLSYHTFRRFYNSRKSFSKSFVKD